MKNASYYFMDKGKLSLKYYSFWTPGFHTYKSKSKVIEALNLGMQVYMKDKIMGYVHFWDHHIKEWVKLIKAEPAQILEMI